MYLLKFCGLGLYFLSILFHSFSFLPLFPDFPFRFFWHDAAAYTGALDMICKR